MSALRLLSSIAVEPIEEVANNAITFDGPSVFAEFELFNMTFRLNESVAVQWLVMIFLGTLFFVLGRNLKLKPETKRQAIAEMIVGLFSGMVRDSMGTKYHRYTPYIAGLFCYSMFLSFSTLVGLRPPTADISVIAAWGILTFVFTQFNRFKTGGLWGGVKGFAMPIPVMLPMNLMSEISNPVSQSFRHYGNILAGVIIGGLIYWALPIPVIIPAAMSLYFDVALGALQAFVFATLTMVYVAMADSGPEADG
jgi:F-type H+-transporting ATPase subunit a